MNAVPRVGGTTRRIIWLAAVVVVMALLGYCTWDYMVVDKCLDAGGRWDHKLGVCDRGSGP